MRGLLAAAILLPLGLAAATAPAARPLQPHTLVTTPGEIHAFAQDGDRIGWIAEAGRVRVRRLSTRQTWVVGRVDPGRAQTAALALAGSRALWAFDSGGNSEETTIARGATGAKPVGVDLLSGGVRGTGDGVRFSGVAGDGPTLAYGWVVEQCPDQWFGICEPGVPDEMVATLGGIALVRAGQPAWHAPPVIPGLAFPAIFTVGDGWVALAPARSPTPTGEWSPRVAEDGPVNVYSLRGTLMLSERLDGIVRDLALFGDRVVVLLEQPNGSRVIQRFNVKSGARLLPSRALSPSAADVSAGSGGIVFRVGRSIYMLSGRTPKLLTRATATPIGLSIEGRRVAWAVNLRGRGQIVALTLPR